RLAAGRRRPFRRGPEIAGAGQRREAGRERLQTDWLWRAVSAARQAAPLLFQTVRAGHEARSQARPHEKGFTQGDGGPCPRRRSIDGNVSKMKTKNSSGLAAGKSA